MNIFVCIFVMLAFIDSFDNMQNIKKNIKYTVGCRLNHKRFPGTPCIVSEYNITIGVPKVRNGSDIDFDYCQEFHREDMKWKRETRGAHMCRSPRDPSRKMTHQLHNNLQY